MFIVAGEVIHRVSGLQWADFIEQRIMKPVGMTASFGSYNRAKNSQTPDNQRSSGSRSTINACL